MLGVKTAISIEKSLFNQVKQLASEMHMSRSKLFSLAVRDFLQKKQNKKLLAQLNAAYSNSSCEEEKTISKAMHKKQ